MGKPASQMTAEERTAWAMVELRGRINELGELVSALVDESEALRSRLSALEGVPLTTPPPETEETS